MCVLNSYGRKGIEDPLRAMNGLTKQSSSLFLVLFLNGFRVYILDLPSSLIGLVD